MAMSPFMRPMSNPPMRGGPAPVPGFQRPSQPRYGTDIAPPKPPSMSPFNAPWNPKPVAPPKTTYFLPYSDLGKQYEEAMTKYIQSVDPEVKKFQERYGTGASPELLQNYLETIGYRKPKIVRNPDQRSSQLWSLGA